MKCYVLMVAKTFPGTHPKRGKKTDFQKKIFAHEKLHTVRGGFERWKKKMDEVRNGDAYLSLRSWRDYPYKSPQEEFQRVTSNLLPGVQRIDIDPEKRDTVVIDGESWNRNLVAIADGLTWQDFDAWFPEGIKDGALIHFTDFRYEL